LILGAGVRSGRLAGLVFFPSVAHFFVVFVVVAKSLCVGDGVGMMQITKTTKTIASGKLITITGKLVTEQRRINADGHTVMVDRKPEIVMTTTVEGIGEMVGYCVELTDYNRKIRNLPAVYTHIIDRLPLTQDQADLWYSVRNELMATAEYRAHADKVAKIEAERVVYDSECATIRKAMSI
jgi:hypothetical protein